MAIVLAGIPLYVLPATDDPETVDVDVAYVIGPPTDARIKAAIELIREGRAGALLVSADVENLHGDWNEARRVCSEDGHADVPDDVETLCDRPDPFTTRGEARWLEEEMAAHGWESAAVVTFTPHISRTRMIMQRCDTGDISMVDSGSSMSARNLVQRYVHETAGFVKALVLQGC